MGLTKGFKQTEVGVIPEDWDVKRLGKVATFKTGPFGSALHRSDYFDDGIPVVNPMQILDGKIVPTRSMAITEEAARKLSDFRLQAGTIVIGRRGEMGRCAFVQPEQNGWLCGTGSMIIRTGPSLDARFIQRVLSSPPIIAEIENASVGTTMINLNQGTLGNLLVPLPPTKCEQESIAQALSDADALIESLEQLLSKKRRLKEGAMQELLTGKIRMPGFRSKSGYTQSEIGIIPEDWRAVSAADACSKIQDGTHFSPKISGNDYLYLTSKNIRRGFLDLSTADRIDAAQHQKIYRRCDVKQGDILLTKDGASTGNAALNTLHEQFSLLSSVAFLRPHVGQYSSAYLLQQILSSEGQRQIKDAMSGNAITRLTLGKIKKLRFPVPRTKSEQDAIATALFDMDAEIVALKAKLTKARELKMGMTQELLTGRIRLVRSSVSVVPFAIKQKVVMSPGTAHNPQINEAVVIAVLAGEFGSEEYPLARVRRTKLTYLLHRHAEHEAKGFLKKAAGPYNPQTRYGGPEKIAVKNGYVRSHHNGTYEGFVAGDNISQAMNYFEQWYGSPVLEWIERLRFKSTEELELLSTVDMASEGLLREGKNVNLPAVKEVLSSSIEWKAKLDRPIFSDDKIVAAIQMCQQLFAPESDTA
jgi:type I restriction enzyme, S subunit